MVKPRVLLTGGSGMVGRNLLEHADAGNFEWVAPARAECDFSKFSEALSCMQETRPDFVVHAAGRVGGIHDNIVHPVEFLVDNLDLGRNVVLAARQSGIWRLLNLGSSCMYPRNSPNPLREEMILEGALEPTNEGYALAKVVTARLCAYIQREDASLQYKTMIPCNLFGRYDKFSLEHSHLVAAVIRKLHEAQLTGSKEVEIWGDGTARREFMYARDLADAIFFALADFERLPSLINIGVGRDHSIEEYYHAAAEVVGWKGEFRYDTEKPVGMQRKLVDTTRQSEWGWAPQTSLRDGLRLTVDYFREQCG